MIGVYNDERQRYAAHKQTVQQVADIEDFVVLDTAKISWNRSLRNDAARNKPHAFDPSCIAMSDYRPFHRQRLYFNRGMNNDVSLTPRIFPSDDLTNNAIFVAGAGAKDFSVLMCRHVPCFDFVEKGQCFPRYLYEVADEPDEDAPQGELLARQPAGQLTRRDAITDEGLKHFTDAYPGEAITKDDVFYYVYGLLHSEEYRERYADNLTKQLPRIPLMKRVEDFRAFVAAGRRLGDLHVNFESVELFPITIKEGDLRLANIPDPVAYYRVEKMKFGGKRPNLDKTTVIYNPKITLTGIPLEAYDYVVNGKPALEWVMERQCVKTDPASGIVNDANRYAIETVGDPAYPFKLFCRIITVSLETMKIVRSLPGLDIRQ